MGAEHTARPRGARSTRERPVPETDDTTLLNDQTRRLHRALIDAVLETGSVPGLSALADQLDTPPEAIQEGLRDLAAADYLALDTGGQVTCLYPLSVSPTPHAVVIDGVRRFAMCAIDALGIPAMLDQELDIEGSCAVCDAPIALRVLPGTVVTVVPATTMVVARRDEAEPAFAACCPFTVFVCSQEHAEQFVRRITGAHTLPLTEALTHAEEIFGGLLAEEIPASRPRGRRWGQPRHA
jgi:hypothetical protein